MQAERIVCLGVAIALFSGAAVAQDAASSGLYGRLEGGVSFPETLKQDLAFNPDIVSIVTPPSRQTVDAGTGYAAGGAIGFRYDNGVRTELEYRYQSSDIDEVRFAGGVGVGIVAPPAPPEFIDPNATAFPDASLTAHLLMTNVIYEFRNSSRLTPFIGGGVGGAWVKSSLGVGDATDTDLTYAYQGRAGVALAINRSTRVGVEYVYVRTGELNYGPEEFTPTGPAGPQISEGEFAASTALLSFEKSF